MHHSTSCFGDLNPSFLAKSSLLHTGAVMVIGLLVVGTVERIVPNSMYGQPSIRRKSLAKEKRQLLELKIRGCISDEGIRKMKWITGFVLRKSMIIINNLRVVAIAVVRPIIVSILASPSDFLISFKFA